MANMYRQVNAATQCKQTDGLKMCKMKQFKKTLVNS